MSETTNPTTEIESDAGVLTAKAAVIKVIDALTYGHAAEFLKGIKRYEKRVEETFGPMKRKAKAAHTEVCEQEKKHLGPALEAEAAVKATMLTWKRAEDARVAKERRAAEEAAREEAKRRAEEEQIARAQAAKDQGDDEVAEAILDAPVAPVPVMPMAPPPAVPAVAGISGRKVYKFEVIDEASVPRDFLVVDTKKIGQLARMHKEQAKLAGVRFYVDDGLSVRA